MASVKTSNDENINVAKYKVIIENNSYKMNFGGYG